jgi:type II secretory pathway component GspD/PulD (secretin)
MKYKRYFVLATGGIIAFLLRGSAFSQAPSAATTKSPVQTPAPRVFSSPCLPVIDVCDLLKQYESLTHLKIIRDNFVQGKLSINDVSGLAPAKAIEVIERTLFTDGFAITQIDSDTVEVSGFGKNPRSIGVPVVSDAKELPNQERLVSFVFGFKYRNCREMQQMFLRYLMPEQPYTSLIADAKGNTLLVTERTSVVRSLIEIASKMDVPEAKKEP